MKIFNFCLFCIVLSLFFGALLSCPTCIGKLSQDSPPFFSDEVYQVDENKKPIQTSSLTKIQAPEQVQEHEKHEAE